MRGVRNRNGEFMFLDIKNGHYFGAWYNTLIDTMNDMDFGRGVTVYAVVSHKIILILKLVWDLKIIWLKFGFGWSSVSQDYLDFGRRELWYIIHKHSVMTYPLP